MCLKEARPRIKAKRKQRILTAEQIEIEKLRNLFHSVKSRAKKKHLPFEISFSWLREQCFKQNGCCLLTGIKLDFLSGNKKNPFSPSIDQIIAGAGYLESNARLVCTAINLALNEFGDATFRSIAEGFIKNVKA